MFMRWQMAEHRAGRLSRKKMGGWGWELPKAKENGKPAPLPADVIKYQEEQQRLKIQERQEEDVSDDDSDNESSDEASDAYTIDTRLQNPEEHI